MKTLQYQRFYARKSVESLQYAWNNVPLYESYGLRRMCLGAWRLMIIIGLDVKVSKLHFESTTLMHVNYVSVGNNHR